MTDRGYRKVDEMVDPILEAAKDIPTETEKPNTPEDYRTVLERYLNSSACMSLFSSLTLLRAQGENPAVKIAKRGLALRVSLHRSNGEVLHFNRDGKP